MIIMVILLIIMNNWVGIYAYTHKHTHTHTHTHSLTHIHTHARARARVWVCVRARCRAAIDGRGLADIVAQSVGAYLGP